MKLIISEKSRNILFKRLIQEEMNGWSDKVEIVKKFLDDNFLKATNSTTGENGRPKLHDIVIWVDKFKQPRQYMSDVDLFYLLQDEFKTILPTDEDGGHTSRDNFLKQCIKDWYYNKISKNNVLSLYEGRQLSGWNYTNRAYVVSIQDRCKNPQAELNIIYDGETSLEGAKSTVITTDVNRMADRFMEHAHGDKALNNISALVADMPGSSRNDNSPDLFHVFLKYTHSRECFKWVFLYPKQISQAYGVNNNVYLLKAMLTERGGDSLVDLVTDKNKRPDLNVQSHPFASKPERNQYLPFLPTYINLRLQFTGTTTSKELVVLAKSFNPNDRGMVEQMERLNYETEEFLNNCGLYAQQPLPQIGASTDTHDVFQDVDIDDIQL